MATETEKHICAFAALQNSAQGAGRVPDAVRPTRQNSPMRNVWLCVVLVSISLLAGMGHAQTCSFQFRTPMGVPVADRPALPVPVAMNTAQPMPGPSCQASTWVSATMPSGVTNMRDIAYGNGLFVAVAGAFTGQARVLTSTNGITWTSSSTPVPNDTGFDDIAFGNGVFVGTNANNSDRVMYSTDGINWISAGQPLINLVDVQYANGLFMFVSNNLVPHSRTSPDGVNWTIRAMPPVSGTTGLAYGNGRWVVVSAGTGNPVRAAYSTDDGTTWVPSTTDLSSYLLYAVTFGAGRFVAVGDNGVALTSVDGANWILVNTGVSRDFRAATYGHGQFVIGNGNFNTTRHVMTSVNGINWNFITPTIASYANIESLYAGPDRFFFTESNARGVWYSTN